MRLLIAACFLLSACSGDDDHDSSNDAGVCSDDVRLRYDSNGDADGFTIPCACSGIDFTHGGASENWRNAAFVEAIGDITSTRCSIQMTCEQSWPYPSGNEGQFQCARDRLEELCASGQAGQLFEAGKDAQLQTSACVSNLGACQDPARCLP